MRLFAWKATNSHKLSNYFSLNIKKTSSQFNRTKIICERYWWINHHLNVNYYSILNIRSIKSNFLLSPIFETYRHCLNHETKMNLAKMKKNEIKKTVKFQCSKTSLQKFKRKVHRTQYLADNTQMLLYVTTNYGLNFQTSFLYCSC